MNKRLVPLLISLFAMLLLTQSAFGHEPVTVIPAPTPGVVNTGLYGDYCAGPNREGSYHPLPKLFNVCGVITNRTLGFNTRGGDLSTTQHLQVTNFVGTKATYVDGSKVGDITWNQSVWESFRSGGRESGLTHIETTGGALHHGGVLHHKPVAVDFSWMNMNGRNSGSFAMLCPETTYLVCRTPEVFSHEVSTNVPDITGFASIESRPLIVKIINQTDQPLVRSTQAYTTNLMRDLQVADPETINAMHNGRVGNGYYHFYRDSSKVNNATVSYTFAAGTEGTALTHGVLDIDIVVDEAGNTTTSTCRAPEGLDVTVQCVVTMIGSAEGILTAIVSIGA